MLVQGLVEALVPRRIDRALLGQSRDGVALWQALATLEAAGKLAGWLEQPRQWLGARWQGLLPWLCRAAWSRQARPKEAQGPSSGTAGGGGALVPMPLSLGVVVEQVVKGATHEDEVGYARAVEVEHDRPVDEHRHLRPVRAGELHEAREAPACRKTKLASCGAHHAVGWKERAPTAAGCVGA